MAPLADFEYKGNEYTFFRNKKTSRTGDPTGIKLE